jgi:hypothetical protein
MSSGGPIGGAFRHQHGDPRSLRDRIDAQLRARLEEAVEMAGLDVVVEARKRAGGRAPEDGNVRDRNEVLAMAGSFLDTLHQRLSPALPDDARAAFEAAMDSASDGRTRQLAGQVFLAKRMPDYWQRFEEVRADFTRERLGRISQSPGWLRRRFGG